MILKMEVSSITNDEKIDNSWLPKKPSLIASTVENPNTNTTQVSQLRFHILENGLCAILLDSGSSLPIKSGQKIVYGEYCLTVEIEQIDLKNEGPSRTKPENNSSYFVLGEKKASYLDHSQQSASIDTKEYLHDPLSFLYTTRSESVANNKLIEYSEEDLFAVDSNFKLPAATQEIKSSANQYQKKTTSQTMDTKHTKNEGNILRDLGFE